jgi:hypothetical protein
MRTIAMANILRDEGVRLRRRGNYMATLGQDDVRCFLEVM